MFQQQPQRNIQLNPPFCAKCKKQIVQASVQVNPIDQTSVLRYVCHGVHSEMKFTQAEMFEFGPNTTLIDFVEFSRVDNVTAT